MTEQAKSDETIIVNALTILGEDGRHWTQGALKRPWVTGHNYCLVGALGKAAGIKIKTFGLNESTEEVWEQLPAGVRSRINQAIAGEHWEERYTPARDRPWKFNDREHTRFADVSAVLKRAARDGK